MSENTKLLQELTVSLKDVKKLKTSILSKAKAAQELLQGDSITVVNGVTGEKEKMDIDFSDRNSVILEAIDDLGDIRDQYGVLYNKIYDAELIEIGRRPGLEQPSSALASGTFYRVGYGQPFDGIGDDSVYVLLERFKVSYTAEAFKKYTRINYFYINSKFYGTGGGEQSPPPDRFATNSHTYIWAYDINLNKINAFRLPESWPTQLQVEEPEELTSAVREDIDLVPSMPVAPGPTFVDTEMGQRYFSYSEKSWILQPDSSYAAEQFITYSASGDLETWEASTGFRATVARTVGDSAVFGATEAYSVSVDYLYIDAAGVPIFNGQYITTYQTKERTMKTVANKQAGTSPVQLNETLTIEGTAADGKFTYLVEGIQDTPAKAGTYFYTSGDAVAVLTGDLYTDDSIVNYSLAEDLVHNQLFSGNGSAQLTQYYSGHSFVNDPADSRVSTTLFTNLGQTVQWVASPFCASSNPPVSGRQAAFLSKIWDSPPVGKDIGLLDRHGGGKTLVPFSFSRAGEGAPGDDIFAETTLTGQYGYSDIPPFTWIQVSPVLPGLSYARVEEFAFGRTLLTDSDTLYQGYRSSGQIGGYVPDPQTGPTCLRDDSLQTSLDYENNKPEYIFRPPSLGVTTSLQRGVNEGEILDLTASSGFPDERSYSMSRDGLSLYIVILGLWRLGRDLGQSSWTDVDILDEEDRRMDDPALFLVQKPLRIWQGEGRGLVSLGNRLGASLSYISMTLARVLNDSVDTGDLTVDLSDIGTVPRDFSEGGSPFSLFWTDAVDV